MFAILGSIAYAFTHDVKQFILDGLGTVDASAAAAIAVRNFRKGNIAFHAKHNIRPTCIVIGWIKSEALSIIINGLAIDIESEFRDIFRNVENNSIAGFGGKLLIAINLYQLRAHAKQ